MRLGHMASYGRSIDEVNSWTRESVVAWATGARLSPAIISIFGNVENGIDGAALLLMTKDDFITYCGLGVGDATKLVFAITVLKSEILGGPAALRGKDRRWHSPMHACSHPSVSPSCTGVASGAFA